MRIIALLSVLILFSCSEKKIKKYQPQNTEKLPVYLNKYVQLSGVAYNVKLGALIAIENDSNVVWMDGLSHWPKGFYGQNIRVAGILIEKYDLPVFISTGKLTDPSGIPVPEGSDLKKASKRYLLKDIEWELIK